LQRYLARICENTAACFTDEFRNGKVLIFLCSAFLGQRRSACWNVQEITQREINFSSPDSKTDSAPSSVVILLFLFVYFSPPRSVCDPEMKKKKTLVVRSPKTYNAALCFSSNSIIFTEISLLFKYW